MILKNKLNITDAVELARVEEKLSKANKLFNSGFLDTLKAGSVQSSADIPLIPTLPRGNAYGAK